MTKGIITAREYAFRKHDLPSDCQRYGNAPYSKHLEDVVGVGRKYLYYIDEAKHETVLCALYLHDTIEDTDTNARKLEQKFGIEVADLVYRVSNERGFDRKERNFKTYPKIWASDLAIFVKLSDRIANTRNSKFGGDSKGRSMFKTYKCEYPVFRYALKVHNLYPDMWVELDDLYEFKID